MEVPKYSRGMHSVCSGAAQMFPRSAPATRLNLGAVALIVSSACLLLAAANQQVSATEATAAIQSANTASANNNQLVNDKVDAQQVPRNALEAELNSIVKAHYDLGGNDKKLAEAIISRLLVDNLTGSEQVGGAGGETPASLYDQLGGDVSVPAGGELSAEQPNLGGLSGQEALRVRNYLVNSLYNHETFPMLPFSEAATMKRATKLGLALKQRHAGTRNGLDYTYGSARRTENSADDNPGDVLRLGDLISSAGTLKRPVGQFDKRPSSHRYDFGLGKRVASPTYPSRYDFGLGKRVPNYVRYDFGLGKK